MMESSRWNSNYVVSFCIPTYDRADAICRVVTQILSCSDARFQVVVSDNNSTDPTWERLSAISDTRLKLCKNPYPCTPPHLNWLNALNHGDGRWLYLVMGRDLILADNIPKLIRYLEAAERKKPDVAFIFENYFNHDRCHYYTQKADALNRFVRACHPTGTIFRRDVFMEIPDKEKACRTIDTFPENYFKSEIIRNWNCIELPSTVYKEGQWAWGESVPRSTFDPNPKSLHFFPDRCTKQGIQMMELVASHSLSDAEQDNVFIEKWKQIMYWVSEGGRQVWASNKQCKHYGLTARKVPKKEMLQNILQAYREVNRHYPHMSFRRKRMMLTTMLSRICEMLLVPYYESLKRKLKHI